MDKNLLKTAAAFALHYKRVHGQGLSVAALVAGSGAQDRIDQVCARANGDAALDKAARDFARAAGLVPAMAPVAPVAPVVPIAPVAPVVPIAPAAPEILVAVLAPRPIAPQPAHTQPTAVATPALTPEQEGASGEAVQGGGPVAIAVTGLALEPVEAGERPTDRHWQMIMACAQEVAGPMSDIWIEQAHSTRPATLKQAIVASTLSMGAFGEDFAKALRRHLRAGG